MASGLTSVYLIPYPLSTDPVDVHGDIRDLADRLDIVLNDKPDKNLPNVYTQQNLFNVNSATDAVRINQTGTGNAFVVEDSANPDTTPFVIDATGRVGIGKTAPTVLFDVAGVGAFSGALTASTFNALTLTAAATGFTIAGGTTSKTLTISNTLTLAGTDATTMTFPSTSQTIVGLTATQTLTNKSLSDSTTWFVDAADNTKRLNIDVTGTTGITGVLQTAFTTAKTVVFQDVAGTVYVSTGTDVTLADGGTNASLTASNGGIVYSTASAMAILAGTATAGQMLQSGASTTPAWSTATFPSTATGTGTILRANGTNWVATTTTYPTTTTANQILYSSAANTIGEITTANSQVLVTNGSGVPAFSGTLPSGVTASSLTSFGTSPTLTTPTIDVINASSATATTPSLYANTTSGTINIGTLVGSTAATGTINIGNNAGITSGTKAINIGTGATAGTTTITVGSTTATTTTFNGTVNLPTSTTKVGQTFLLQGGAVNITFPTLAGTLVGTGDSGSISTAMLANSSSTTTGVTYAKMQYVSAQYNIHGRITAGAGVVEELTPNNLVTVLAQSTTRTGGTTNIVFDSSPTITTPVIDTINISALGTSGALWNTTMTTGSISMGGSLTTGGVNIATGSAFNGTIAIGTGAGTVNKIINIGTSSTSGTTAIVLGSTAGATSTIGLNGTTTVTGTLSTTGSLTVGGDLAVNGTLTTVNSNTVTVDDKNLELGSVIAGTVSTTGTIGTVSGTGPFTSTITGMSSTTGIVPGSVITATAGTGNFGSGVMTVASIVSNTSITVSSTLTFTAGTVTNILGGAPTDATANGGGITLKGATDKSIIWDSTNNNWTSSENWNIPTGKTFKINNVSVLSSTAVLGVTHTINATGYTLTGGTTPVGVTFAGGTAYTISGTNGQTYTMPSAGGTLITNPMTTLGDIVYGGASGIVTRLAGNTTNGTYGLTSVTTASAATAPVWTLATGTGAPVYGTAPSIAGGTHTGLTSLGIRDTSAAFDVTIAATSSTALTAARSLTLDLINAARTIKLAGNIDLGGNLTTTGTFSSGGNFSTASTFTTSGAFGLTLTATNTTNATIPAGTVTLVDLATSQALTNKTISGLTVTTTTGTLTMPAATVTHAGAFATTITATAITNATLPAGTTTLAANVTTTIGDLIYASATGTPGTLTRLAGNTTTSRRFLRQTGDGTNSAAPAWDALVDGDIPSALTGKSYNGLTLTSTTGTFTLAAAKTLTVSNTITLTGTDGVSINLGATNGTLGSAAFTASSAYEPAITTLAISKGGTGTGTAPTQYGVIYASSATAYASTAAGTNTQVLIGNAAGAPSWTNISGLSVSSASTATTATNLSGTTQYSIPYQSASATTGYVSIGTAGQVLAVNGTTNGYSWISPLTNPMTTLGDLIVGGASGAATRLAGSAVNGTYGLTAVVSASAAVAPTWVLATGTGAPVHASTPTITTPKIDSISTTTGAAATPTLWSDVTTGSIAIGSGITTGTVNIATAGTGANAINIGNTNSTLTVNGNLTVNGTTTTVNSVTITVDDPNLELNSVASPTDANASGGGITLKSAAGDKTIVWDVTNTNWTANQHFNIPTGKVYKINNAEVLSSTAVLGITHTINATGFALAGGTTSKTLTVQNTLTLAGTDSSTLNIGTGGTLGTAAFTASSAYEPAITTLAISKGGTGTATAPTQYGIIYAGSTTAYASTAAGTAGQVLVGSATTPTWTSISTLSVGSAALLTTPRLINGVSFDGSADITISASAAAGSLTGSTLAAGVVNSSLTSLGTLTSLTVSGNLTVSGVVTVPTPTNNTDAANKAYVDSVLNAGVPEIVPLDDISGEFNGVNSIFVPKYQGIKQSITNPLRLQLTINGIIQYVDFPDYVWQSPLPREGFQINNDGNIAFSEVVPAGSRFSATIQPGPNTITKKRQYPFKAVDILLGG